MLQGNLVASSWVLASTIIFFPAFSMYAWNVRYFNIRTSALISLLLILTAALTFSFAFVLSIFKEWGHACIVIQIVLSVAILIQGALPFKYEIFTTIAPTMGKPIYGRIDSLIWIIVFMLGVFFREWISRNVFTISACFTAMQLFINLALPVLANWTALISGEGSTVINGGQLYSYSSEGNIAVFIIDSLQSTALAESLKDDPEMMENFEGFILYQDALSMYNATALAIPGLLSGEYYLNQGTVRDYTKKAFFSECSLLELARKMGYEVSFESFESFPGITKKTSFLEAPNIVEYFSKGLRSRSILKFSLLDLIYFKVMPHYFKLLKFNEKSSIRICSTMAQNSDFIERFDRRFSLNDTKPTFHVYHIPGVHLPMVLNEGKERKILANTFSEYKQYCVILFRDFVRIIDRMKESGIYDCTTVIIIGDHGIPIGKTDNLPAPHLQSAIAVKPCSSSGSLSYSAIELSLSDLKGAIADDLNRHGSVGDYFQRVPKGARRRDVYEFDSSRRMDVAKVPLLGYAVRGDVGLRDSWAFTGRLDVMELNFPRVRTIAFDEKVSSSEFEEASPAGIVLSGDWALVEREGVWTTGKTAGIRVPIPFGYTGGDLHLRFDGFAYVSGGKTQHVDVRVNGTRAASWSLTPDRPEIPPLWIPEAILGEEQNLDIAFFIVDPSSPFELGTDSLDHRHLGVFIQAVTVSIAPPFESGIKVQTRDLHSKVGLASGWGRIEEKGIWSEGREAVLRISLPLGANQDRELCLEGFAYCPVGYSQRVEVHVDGIMEKMWVLSPSNSTLPSIKIPKAQASGGSCLELRFIMPDAKSPHELGIDPHDHRKLGIFLQGITWLGS